MMKHYVRLACFVGGALFGSAGVKLLTSKDAKKAYTHITAAFRRQYGVTPAQYRKNV